MISKAKIMNHVVSLNHVVFTKITVNERSKRVVQFRINESG